MKKSQSFRNKIIVLNSLVIFLVCAQPHLAIAQARRAVNVTIESENHVNVGHNLTLTFTIPPARYGEGTKISINSGPVLAGAGLVVKHIAGDGTKITQSLPAEDWWFSKAETLEIKSSYQPWPKDISMSFSIWVQTGLHLDFSKLGIYRICYVHPWTDPEEDPNSLLLRSNSLTIACVTQERNDQLHKMLRQDPELALASYWFKNPSRADEHAKFRGIPKKLLEAIEKGSKQDKVLLLLGSPDYISRSSKGEEKMYGWDEMWHYETSPVGGLVVHFKNGEVVRAQKHTDWSGEN